MGEAVGGWRSVYEESLGVIHVVPVNDVVNHEMNSEGTCVCVPKAEVLDHPSGRDVWMYTHSSLDGREQAE